MSSLPPYNRADAELVVHLLPESEVWQPSPPQNGAEVLRADGLDVAALLERRGVVVVTGDEGALGRLLRTMVGASPERPPIRFPPGGRAELLVNHGHVTLRSLNRGATGGDGARS